MKKEEVNPKVVKLRIKIEIYHAYLDVYFSKDIVHTISTMFENISILEARGYAAGWFRRDYKGIQEDIIIFDLNNFTINSMVHEIGHAVGSILSSRGVVYNCENDEPFTYLQGYIAGKIFKKVLKLNCKIKAE